MELMTDTQLLDYVKKSNLIVGDSLDAMLLIKITEVKQYMLSAGVSESVVNSDIAAGTIAIGVNDLYTPQGTGGTQKLSQYFMQRVIQLR